MSLHEICYQKPFDPHRFASLLEAKANINILGGLANADLNYSSTPAHCACEYNNDTALSYLIAAGADLSILDGDGCAPIHNACMRDSAKSLKLLISAGVCLDIRDGFGYTPLCYAAMDDEPENVPSSTLSQLITAGAVLDPHDGGDNPVAIASGYGNHRSLLQLIAAGADINVRGRCGQYRGRLGDTPATVACRLNKPAVLGILISADVDLDVCNGIGDFPHEVAAAAESHACSQLITLRRLRELAARLPGLAESWGDLGLPADATFEILRWVY